ncbi:MAG: hypothetical protein AAFP70_21910 [Calditrichota bacterium]
MMTLQLHKFFSRIAILIPFVFFFSCSSNSIRIIAKPEISTVDSPGLAVISKEKVFIMDSEEFNRHIPPENANKEYLSFFAEEFVNQLKIKGTFNDVSYQPVSADMALSDTTIKVNSKTRLTVSIPRSGTSVSTSSIDADYALFIQRNATHRHEKEGLKIDLLQPSANTSLYLALPDTERMYQEITFVLWDNRMGQVISIGRGNWVWE